jgi:hypothetical protein
MVYLALRMRPKSNKLKDWFFHLAIASKLMSPYSHGGIYSNGYMYEVTAESNMTKTRLHNTEGWHFFKTDVEKDELETHYEKYKDYKYDWFSLLAFLNFDARDSKRLYCFEWCYIVLTGTEPHFKVTPEMLINWSSIQV